METKKIQGLNTIDEEKIEKTVNVQKELGWSYYSERELVENLVSQRFNYFVVAFSLFITAAATVTSPKSLAIILCIGIVILSALWITIIYSYIWLDIVFRILHNLPYENDMFKVIREERSSRLYHVSVNKWIGILIPLFCLLLLITGLILVLTGVLTSLK